MRFPKLLPWVAKKAGISPHLAEQLWHRADSEARQRLGGLYNEGELSRYVLERWLDLVESESPTKSFAPSSSVLWAIRSQQRLTLILWCAGMSAWQQWQGKLTALRNRLGHQCV